jgi:hypothetical protein
MVRFRYADYRIKLMSKIKDFTMDEETKAQIFKVLEEEHEYFKNFGRWGKYLEEFDEELPEEFSDF